MGHTARDKAILDALVRWETDAQRTTIERWCPQKPYHSQQLFFDATEDEVLFGGQAGPGKSSAILMRALKYVDVPGYSALLLRKTYVDLSGAGAIMDRLRTWLLPTAAHWSEKDKTWTFPSGARIAFGYLEGPRDHERYQGPEYQFIGVDELTQHRETQIVYLLSRLRAIKEIGVPCQFGATSNPGGIGHKWVKERFVDDATRLDGCRYIPASIEENTASDIEAYKRKLMRLDETTRRQLMDGEWIEDTQGLVYKFSRVHNVLVDLPTASDWEHVLGIDFGASLASPTTAFAVWAYSVALGVACLVLAYKKPALTVTDIAEHWRAIDSVYHPRRTVADHGALGRGYIQELRKRHGIPVVDAKKSDKFGHIKILNGDLERQRAMVVDDSHTQDWQDEVAGLMWDETGLREMKGVANHCADAAQYAYREARHFLHSEEAPLPPEGTQAYYEREANQMRTRAMQMAQRQKSDDPLAGMFR